MAGTRSSIDRDIIAHLTDEEFRRTHKRLTILPLSIDRNVRELGGLDSFTVGEGKAGSAAGLPSFIPILQNEKFC